MRRPPHTPKARAETANPSLAKPLPVPPDTLWSPILAAFCFFFAFPFTKPHRAKEPRVKSLGLMYLRDPLRVLGGALGSVLVVMEGTPSSVGRGHWCGKGKLSLMTKASPSPNDRSGLDVLGSILRRAKTRKGGSVQDLNGQKKAHTHLP